MTKEEKQLLFKDLCARLPYGVKVKYIFDDGSHCPFELSTKILQECLDKGFLPYLRPMSSMTEEEKREFNKLIGGENTNWELFDEKRITHSKSFYSVFCCFSTMGKIIDFFNLHHLDYSGLIQMGLALEVPKGMYE